MTIKVILVDDEPLLRAGLRLMIDGAEDIEVIAEAGDGKEAIAAIGKHQPDVVLMDIRMPYMNGIEVLESIGARIPTIMLTAFDTDEFIVRALKAGALGFLLKTTAPEAIVKTIHSAYQGQQVLSPLVLNRLLKKTSTPNASLGNLSDREIEIANLVAKGMSNKEIANTLFVSITTVKTHIARIMEKLNVPSRLAIAIAVIESR